LRSDLNKIEFFVMVHYDSSV